MRDIAVEELNIEVLPIVNISNILVNLKNVNVKIKSLFT